MKTKAKTIQIYLPSGDPLGIREAMITTRLLRVIEVPRTGPLLAEFFQMPESEGGTVYFLVEGETDEPKPRVYIGQTFDVKARFQRHLVSEGKEFWQKALVVTSRADSLTPAHVLRLERLCIQRAKEAGRYKVHNDKDGQKVPLDKHLESECEELFETCRLLLETLGVDLFTKLGQSSQSEPAYICTKSGVEAKARYTNDGNMVVLKGSKARLNVAENFKTKPLYQKRQNLIDAGVLKEVEGYLVFEDDQLLNSPSTAASLVIGNSTNGWEAWETPEGKTLDEVIRKAAETVSSNTNG